MTQSLLTHPDCNWRLMQQYEAAHAHALHTKVIKLTPTGMVRQDALEYFEKHIELQGRIVGCFAQERLVAYGVLGLQSPMLSFVAQLMKVNADKQERMCLLDGASCEFDWRGRHLHEDAIALRLTMAKALGRSFIAVTVAPTNLASLRGLLRLGFAVQQYAEVYGGLPRLLLSLDFDSPPAHWQAQQMVASTDLQGHRDALDNGWVGYGCQGDDRNIWSIIYGSRKAG
jgi:hypothetical protein